MAAKIFVHEGKAVTVQYDAKRCIHAAECVRGLPSVFNTSRKPWIDPDAAGADEIAAVVMRCPTGALHFKRKDNGPDEPIPNQNTIVVVSDGPLYVRGNVQLLSQEGGVLATDTRMALCRCGASRNKPFCDNSHLKAGFQDAGALGKDTMQLAPNGEGLGLTITSLPNGPLAIKGQVELFSADKSVCYQSNTVFLCRCGVSANKPFCDGSHKRIGFVTHA